jgi:hypothetical protein
MESNFPHTKSDLPKSAFYFLQWLSAFSNGFPIFLNSFPLSPTAFCFLQWLFNFFNGFPIFLNGFPIFLNGFPLSKKSEKIYLRWQVYNRSPFELRISCHLLPKLRNSHLLRELCNCHLLPKLRNCHSLPELCNHYNACISPNRNIKNITKRQISAFSRL